MKTIEFFGLPGSGKTTCVNQTIDYARSSGFNITGREDFNAFFCSIGKTKKLGLLINYFPVYLKYILPFARCLPGNLFAGIEFWRRVIYSPVDYIFTDTYSDSSALYISDQGSIQGLWSILIRSKCFSNALIKDICSFWAQRKYTLYVHLRIDPATAAQRILERNQGNSLLDGKDYDHTYADLLRYNDYLEYMIKQMRMAGIPLEIIDSEADIQDCVSSILTLALSHGLK